MCQALAERDSRIETTLQSPSSEELEAFTTELALQALPQTGLNRGGELFNSGPRTRTMRRLPRFALFVTERAASDLAQTNIVMRQQNFPWETSPRRKKRPQRTRTSGKARSPPLNRVRGFTLQASAEPSSYEVNNSRRSSGRAHPGPRVRRSD